MDHDAGARRRLKVPGNNYRRKMEQNGSFFMAIEGLQNKNFVKAQTNPAA
jgi:hypothetical protein